MTQPLDEILSHLVLSTVGKECKHYLVLLTITKHEALNSKRTPIGASGEKYVSTGYFQSHHITYLCA